MAWAVDDVFCFIDVDSIRFVLAYLALYDGSSEEREPVCRVQRCLQHALSLEEEQQNLRLEREEKQQKVEVDIISCLSVR